MIQFYRLLALGLRSGRRLVLCATGALNLSLSSIVLLLGDGVNIDLKATVAIVERVKALVRAIECLDVIEPDSPWERQVAVLLRAAYRRRLREIAQTAPGAISREIASTCEEIHEERSGTRLREH